MRSVSNSGVSHVPTRRHRPAEKRLDKRTPRYLRASSLVVFFAGTRKSVVSSLYCSPYLRPLMPRKILSKGINGALNSDYDTLRADYRILP